MTRKGSQVKEDFLGNPLDIGDEIVFTGHGRSALAVGIITKFTSHYVFYRYQSNYRGETEGRSKFENVIRREKTNSESS